MVVCWATELSALELYCNQCHGLPPQLSLCRHEGWALYCGRHGRVEGEGVIFCIADSNDTICGIPRFFAVATRCAPGYVALFAALHKSIKAIQARHQILCVVKSSQPPSTKAAGTLASRRSMSSRLQAASTLNFSRGRASVAKTHLPTPFK